jgi:hypothetical protein
MEFIGFIDIFSLFNLILFIFFFNLFNSQDFSGQNKTGQAKNPCPKKKILPTLGEKKIFLS